MEENRVVWFKTHLDAIPNSCKDCACHWCYLPLKKRKWGYSDELKKKYLLQDQKHVQCVMEQGPNLEQQYQNVLYVMELEL